jgi:hypothetical protein
MSTKWCTLPAVNCITKPTATTQFTHLHPLHKGWLLLATDIYIWHTDGIYLDSHLILGGKGIVTHLNSGLEGTAEKTGNGGAEDTGAQFRLDVVS